MECFKVGRGLLNLASHLPVTERDSIVVKHFADSFSPCARFGPLLVVYLAFQSLLSSTALLAHLFGASLSEDCSSLSSLLGREGCCAPLARMHATIVSQESFDTLPDST